MAISGEEAVAVLLKALPAEVLDVILSRLSPETAGRLRFRLDEIRQQPTGTDRLDDALDTFKSAQKAIEARSGGTNGGAQTQHKTPKSPVEKLRLADGPIEPTAFYHLRDIPPELLVRVLSDEQVPTIALVMSVLEPARAVAVMKLLPGAVRPELSVRMTKPGAKNPELTELLAKAVVEKAIKLAQSVPEPTQDDRIRNISTMLRGLKREERLEIIEALNTADPETCAKVKEQLYLFEDIVRIEDRGLQTVLVELDMPTLALSLSGADPEITAKVQRNMSSRAQAMLGEEIGLLGNVAPAKIQQARAKIVSVLRQFEEEGKIVIEV